ncbi:hypothetical protein AB0B37_35755, partial [Streptomyces olivaceoviridis]
MTEEPWYNPIVVFVAGMSVPLGSSQRVRDEVEQPHLELVKYLDGFQSLVAEITGGTAQGASGDWPQAYVDAMKTFMSGDGADYISGLRDTAAQLADGAKEFAYQLDYTNMMIVLQVLAFLLEWAITLMMWEWNPIGAAIEQGILLDIFEFLFGSTLRRFLTHAAINMVTNLTLSTALDGLAQWILALKGEHTNYASQYHHSAVLSGAIQGAIGSVVPAITGSINKLISKGFSPTAIKSMQESIENSLKHPAPSTPAKSAPSVPDGAPAPGVKTGSGLADAPLDKDLAHLSGWFGPELAKLSVPMRIELAHSVVGKDTQQAFRTAVGDQFERAFGSRLGADLAREMGTDWASAFLAHANSGTLSKALKASLEPMEKLGAKYEPLRSALSTGVGKAMPSLWKQKPAHLLVELGFGAGYQNLSEGIVNYIEQGQFTTSKETTLGALGGDILGRVKHPILGAVHSGIKGALHLNVKLPQLLLPGQANTHTADDPAFTAPPRYTQSPGANEVTLAGGPNAGGFTAPPAYGTSTGASFTAPTINAPSFHVPTLNAPTVNIPTVNAPTVNAPTVGTPTLGAPSHGGPEATAAQTSPGSPVPSPAARPTATGTPLPTSSNAGPTPATGSGAPVAGAGTQNPVAAATPPTTGGATARPGTAPSAGQTPPSAPTRISTTSTAGGEPARPGTEGTTQNPSAGTSRAQTGTSQPDPTRSDRMSTVSSGETRAPGRQAPDSTESPATGHVREDVERALLGADTQHPETEPALLGTDTQHPGTDAASPHEATVAPHEATMAPHEAAGHLDEPARPGDGSQPVRTDVPTGSDTSAPGRPTDQDAGLEQDGAGRPEEDTDALGSFHRLWGKTSADHELPAPLHTAVTEAYVRLGGAPEHADLLIARFGQHIDDFGALVPADRHVAIVAQKLLRGTPQDVDAAVQHARSAGITVSEPERPVTGAATHARPGDEAALKVEDRPALDTAKTFLGTVPPEDLARAEQWARTQVSNDHTWFLDGHHPDAAERRELLGAFVTLLSHSLLTDSVDAARALSLDLARRYGTRRTTGLPGGVDLDEADFLQSPERFPTAGPSRDGNTLEQLMEDIQRRFDELNFDDLDFEDRPETMVGHVTEADEVLPPVVRNVPEDETFVVEELSDDDVELHELPNGHDSGLDESTEHPFVVEVESDGHRGPDEVLTGHVSEPGEELPPHAATVTDTHDDAPEPIFAQAADENPNLPEDFRELTRPIRSYIARAAAQKAEKAKGVKGAKDPEDAEIILMSYPGAHNIVELIRTAGTGHAFVAVRLPGREAPVNLGFRVIEDVSHGRLVDGTAPGGVTHEAADAFDHFSAEILRSYKVDAEQLEKAYQYAEEKSRATYNLIKYNCVVFAQEFVHAATGADMPKLTVNAPNSLIEEMRVGTHRDWVENPRFLELTPEDRLHLERANAWLNNHDRTSEMRWALDRVFIDHQRPVVSGTPSRIQQRQLDLLAHIGTLAAEKYHHAGEAAALELLHDLGVKYGTSRHDHPQIRQTVEHMLEPLRSYAEHAVDPGAKDAEVVVMADQNGQPSLGIRLPGNPRLIGMRFGVGRQDAGTLGWEMKEGSLFLEHSDRPFDPDIEILKTFPVSAAQVLTGYQYALDNIATPYKASSYNSFTFTQEFLTKVLGSDPVASRPTNFSFSKTFNAVFKPETHASSAFHQTMQADVDRSWSKANTPVTELTDTHKESLDRLAHEPVYNTREEFDAAQAWAKLRVALDHQKPSNEQDPETGAAMHDLLRSFRYLIAATYHTQGEHAARQLSWQLGTEHGTWRPTDKRPPQPQQPAHEPVSQHQHTTPEPLATQQPLPERPATPEPLTTPHQHDVLLGDASQPMTDENGFHRFDTADGGTVFISNAHINAQNAVTPAVANLVTKFLNGGLPIHRVHPVTAPRRGYQGEPVTILPAGEAQSPRHDDVESTSFVTFSTTPEGAEHDFRMSGATRSGLSAGLLVDAFVGPDQTIAVIDDKTIQVRDLTVATFADRGPITVFNRPPQQSPDITVLNVRVDENPYKQALTQELTRTDLSPEHRARLQAALNTYDTQITDVAFAPQTPLRPDHTDAGATESTTTGPDTHIGDRVSDTERAAHLEDFAGHWRRWEKSPVRDGGPQELVAGVPIHDALLTAVRLLGHSPEPGFTTRLDETTDPAELSRLEQDALIVADHLLQHPADLPGAMTLGLRLLSDAPYRHDTRLPGGARPEDSGGTWRDMIRSSFSVLRLNQDPRPTTNSRQLAITHIDKVLKDSGLEGQETVGSGIARSIEAIRVAAGENGARDIHTVFQRPELAELYKIPADDPRAEQAHRFIAEQELAYWKKQHAENPTIGTKIAIDVPVATRVQLQKTVGSATDWAERFRKAGTSIGDPFGGSFQFRADTSDSAISGLKHLLSNPDITSRLSEEHLQTLTHALNSYGHQPDTSQTTGPDTHTGDPVSGEERATHLEDFAGHWRRWEKSPVHDGGPQELVAGTPIHDALLTAVQLLGHSPEPGFTSRLENTAGDLISLSRLEQDALIVAGHLLQHPADLPGAMTLGLRLLTDAPYRHDTRLPGGTRPEDSGGTWRDMIRSSFSVLRLNQDPRPTTNSR